MLLSHMVLIAVSTGITLSDVTDNGTPIPNLFIDIQWWQVLVAIVLSIIAALGLSPAPWLLGLAMGRIQFTRPASEAHQREIEKLKETHSRELEAKDAAHMRELAARDAFHEAVLRGRDQRYADLAAIRETDRLAAAKNQERADQLTDAAFRMTEVVRANTHVIESVNEIAREAVGNDPA